MYTRFSFITIYRQRRQEQASGFKYEASDTRWGIRFLCDTFHVLTWSRTNVQCKRLRFPSPPPSLSLS